MLESQSVVATVIVIFPLLKALSFPFGSTSLQAKARSNSECLIGLLSPAQRGPESLQLLASLQEKMCLVHMLVVNPVCCAFSAQRS